MVMLKVISALALGADAFQSPRGAERGVSCSAKNDLQEVDSNKL